MEASALEKRSLFKSLQILTFWDLSFTEVSKIIHWLLQYSNLSIEYSTLIYLKAKNEN